MEGKGISHVNIVNQQTIEDINVNKNRSHELSLSLCVSWISLTYYALDSSYNASNDSNEFEYNKDIQRPPAGRWVDAKSPCISGTFPLSVPLHSPPFACRSRRPHDMTKARGVIYCSILSAITGACRACHLCLA